jgi:hypothetical protein
MEDNSVYIYRYKLLYYLRLDWETTQDRLYEVKIKCMRDKHFSLQNICLLHGQLLSEPLYSHEHL